MRRAPFTLSRRSALGLASALLWVPRPGQAAAPSRRRFLFVFAQGGWDQTRLFAPVFGSSTVDMEEDAIEVETNGIVHVEQPDRPSVTEFFQRYGDRACFINGFEARSVAHDVCLRLVMTGTSLPAADDWPSLIGAATGSDLLLPVINLSGPSYTHDHGSVVVRVGEAGQLPDLISGDAFIRCDRSLALPTPDVEALEDAFVSARVARLAAEAERGRARLLMERSVEVQERMDKVAGLADSLRFGDTDTLESGMDLLVNAFASDLARCGMVKHVGWQHLGWDSHADIAQQSRSFEELFAALLSTMETLDSLPGTEEATLAEEVTLVVMSEMGRYPLLNSRGGKEHWTYTSCMLVGAGVAGGQTIGGYDESCAGRKVDLASGALSDAGSSLLPKHVGSTLLALAGVDPAEYIDGGEAIDAVLA